MKNILKQLLFIIIGWVIFSFGIYLYNEVLGIHEWYGAILLLPSVVSVFIGTMLVGYNLVTIVYNLLEKS